MFSCAFYAQSTRHGFAAWPRCNCCAQQWILLQMHHILLKTGYEDEEGAENELSFQEWTQQLQDMLNTNKFGDVAFRDQDYNGAVEYYLKVNLLYAEMENTHCLIWWSFVASQHSDFSGGLFTIDIKTP